jgi:hypothetical protein
MAHLAACSKSTSRAFEPGVDPADGGVGASFAGEGGAPVVSGCAEENKDVFVLADDRTLYSFHPPTLEFTEKGTLNCPTGGATPTSMAIDREGFAWVRHTDGSVWKVSTRNLTCERSNFQPQPGAFSKFGMGFATETKGGTTEVLYLSDSAGAGLAKLDKTTLGMTLIGPYTGKLAGVSSELTGTGDGNLYGLFVTSPAQVAEISTTTGAIVDTLSVPGVTVGTAWAFSFYGGLFYIYTSRPDGGGSDVIEFDPKSKVAKRVQSDIGFTIVGAGVSTCAPTTSPR